ncbi:hypothetical protein HPB51_012566 [Rhipicephalus microplus]|uniref:Sulfotransferase domain-containing protein n=1 Tax=Rhipicephalus microplus TaxID=6941 RepID=A0A9J6DGM1_RHIMP|nr:hypothetical protein HPB51_012566 [Rhipicephalus microplus]
MEFRLRAPIIEYRPDLPPRPTSKPLRTLCTHLPLCLEKLNPEAKYVYVARNPWDVCVSLYHHVTSLSFYRFQDGTFDDFLEAFFTGRLPYGCYFEHLVAGYSLKDEPNILFLTYEELQRDLRGGVLRLASFMGENHLKDLKENPVEGQNLLDVIVKNTSTDSMKKVMIFDLTKNFYPEVDELLKNLKPSTKAAHAGDAKRHELVRNGKVGQWKEYFSAEQLQRMEAAIKEKTSGSSVMSLWSDIRADALHLDPVAARDQGPDPIPGTTPAPRVIDKEKARRTRTRSSRRHRGSSNSSITTTTSSSNNNSSSTSTRNQEKLGEEKRRGGGERDWRRSGDGERELRRPDEGAHSNLAYIEFYLPEYKFAMAPLMCVYGSGFNNILEFLEEGLYDFTVFDSLYKDDRNPWPEPNKDLLHFLSSARRQQNS